MKWYIQSAKENQKIIFQTTEQLQSWPGSTQKTGQGRKQHEPVEVSNYCCEGPGHSADLASLLRLLIDHNHLKGLFQIKMLNKCKCSLTNSNMMYKHKCSYWVNRDKGKYSILQESSQSRLLQDTKKKKTFKRTHTCLNGTVKCLSLNTLMAMQKS